MVGSELRIGNYLLYNGDYFCVNFIMPKCIIVADRGRGNVEFHIDDLKPIPLSDEILLKCGFEKSRVYNNTYYLRLETINGSHDLFIDIIKNVATIGTVEISEFKHIHNIQNLYFALTSKELEIEL